MPIKLRNLPDPKYMARASKVPITTAKSIAVDTDDSCILLVTPTEGTPLVLSSWENSSVNDQSKFRKANKSLWEKFINLCHMNSKSNA